jgi:hypothetical protein
LYAYSLNPGKVKASRVLVLVRVVSVLLKLSKIEEWRQDQRCSTEEITGQRVTTQKISLEFIVPVREVSLAR